MFQFEIAPKELEIRGTMDEVNIYCFSLGNGWRVPTKEELDEIYHARNYLMEYSCDFEHQYYWSSTEYAADGRVWCKHFGDIIKYDDLVVSNDAGSYPHHYCYFRPVRDKLWK